MLFVHVQVFNSLVVLYNVVYRRVCLSVEQTVVEEGKKVPYFVIVVHLPGIAHPQHTSATSSGGAAGSGVKPNTHGWVVSRKLDEFQALYKQLKQVR